MTVFLDTSALLAVLDADDLNHSTADVVWRKLIESDEQLVTSSFVLVEVMRRRKIDRAFASTATLRNRGLQRFHHPCGKKAVLPGAGGVPPLRCPPSRRCCAGAAYSKYPNTSSTRWVEPETSAVKTSKLPPADRVTTALLVRS